jgi:HEAT repeat protein
VSQEPEASTSTSCRIGLKDAEPLLDALSADSAEARVAVLDALTHLQFEPECWFGLKGYLTGVLGEAAGPEHLAVMEAAARVPLRSVRLQLVHLASEGSADERRFAAFALAKVGEERAVGPLLELLDDPAFALTAARHLALVDVTANREAVRHACSRFGRAKDRWTRFWLALALARSGEYEELHQSLVALRKGDMEYRLEWGEQEDWGDPDLLFAEFRRGPVLPKDTLRHLKSTVNQLQTRDAGSLTGGLLLEANKPPQIKLRAVVMPASPLDVSDGDRARVVAALSRSGKDLVKDQIGDNDRFRARLDQVLDSVKARADRATLVSLAISELFLRQGEDAGEGATNTVAALVDGLGDAYVPDLDGLLTAHRSIRHRGVRAQIAWAASRRGIPFLLAGLTPNLSTDPLAAAHLIAEAADEVTVEEPPYFFAGGGPETPLSPKPGELLDDIVMSGFGRMSKPLPGIPVIDMDELLAAGERAVAEDIERAAQRWILVRVVDVSEPGRRLEIAFRAGAVHEISVAIGPNQEGWLVAAGGKPFDEELGPVADMEEMRVTFLAPSIDVPLTGSIYLPRTGTSRACTFNVRVPDSLDLLEAEIRVHHRNRLVQMARLHGPVAADPARVPPGSRIELAIAPIVPVTADLSSHDGVDAGVVRTEAGTTGVVGSELVSFPDEQFDDVTSTLIQILTELATGDAARRRRLEEAVDDLRALVFQGCQLFPVIGEPLVTSAQGRKLDRLQVLVDHQSDFFPIELVYDLPAPSSDAGLCPQWQTALRTGVCPESHAKEGTRELAATICPSGFWGLSKVIERKVVGPSSWQQLGLARPDNFEIGVRVGPTARRDSLDPPRVALFAASSKVDEIRKGGIASVTKTLERISDETMYVETWDAWVDAVKHRPTLLVLLSHTTEEQEQAALEIGPTNETCLAAQLNPGYVHITAEDAPMPIVLLLGCETAVTDGLQSFVAYFQDFQAGLVVGTTASVLGQRAAPVARAIATELAAASARSKPISAGELMTRMRRKLLAKGELTALCLTAFGDAGWQLGGRAA